MSCKKFSFNNIANVISIVSGVSLAGIIGVGTGIGIAAIVLILVAAVAKYKCKCKK